MRSKRVIALALVATQLVAMTGCGRKNNVAELPLMTATTKQQVLDYYADSLKYDAVVTRAADDEKHETKYEEHVVTDKDTLSKVTDAYKAAEQAMGNTTYNGSDAVSEDVFNYIKAYLNDVQLSNGKVADDGVTTALGYYFVDVKYDTAPTAYGTFNTSASLLGLSGAFTEDYLTGIVDKNTGFLSAAVEAGNTYFLENQISKHITYDDTNLFQVLDGSPVGDSYFAGADTSVEDSETSEDGAEESEETTDREVTDEEATDEEATDEETADDVETDEEATEEEQTDTDEDTESASLEDEEDTENNTESSEENELTADTEDATAEEENDGIGIEDATAEAEDAQANYGNGTDRQVKFDVSYIDSIVGSASDSATAMPELSLVYNIPSSSGTMSGVALYPCGIGGMKIFGYNRADLSGTITLRYVFKESDDGSGNIENINIYPKEMENNIPEFATESNVLIPEYLEQDFENMIERADRVIVDGNIGAMISDDIFTDIGYGVLRGYLMNSTDILKCMSVVRQVVARNIENKAYILEVESTVIEGAKSSNTQGTYRDKSYVVIQQFGDSFKITDWVRISRSMVDEPDIDSGNSTLKRLTALNLTGEVSDTTKEEASGLLNELYTASTNRYLYGPYDITLDDGSTKTYKRGMYDCFNDDTSLLRSDKKEELNSRLRSYLTAYGANVPCKYTGCIDEWIGGYKNQVEFTAEEIMVYGDMQAATYFRTYYLMSSINDVWYIDEMKVLDTEELDPSEIESEYSRIAKDAPEESTEAVVESTEQ